jgi:hypothetical protein
MEEEGAIKPKVSMLKEGVLLYKKAICIFVVAIMTMTCLAAAQSITLQVDIGTDLPFEYTFSTLLGVELVTVQLDNITEETELVIEIHGATSSYGFSLNGAPLENIVPDIVNVYIITPTSDSTISFEANDGMSIKIYRLEKNRIDCPHDFVIHGKTIRNVGQKYTFDFELPLDASHNIEIEASEEITFFAVSGLNVSRYWKGTTLDVADLPHDTSYVRMVAEHNVDFDVEVSYHEPVPVEVPEEEMVFGPVYCERTTGIPNMYEYIFDSDYTNATLHVANNQINASWVVLNGNVIFKPGDFDWTIEELQADVILQDSNFLQVKVSSEPQKGLLVWLTSPDVPILEPSSPDVPILEPSSPDVPILEPSSPVIETSAFSFSSSNFDAQIIQEQDIVTDTNIYPTGGGSYDYYANPPNYTVFFSENAMDGMKMKTDGSFLILTPWLANIRNVRRYRHRPHRP